MYTEENPKSRDRMSITELFMAILLAIILLVFTVPFKNRDYIFDWDQGNDYEATAKIAGGKLALIGPRVTSDSGFFLAPWHYYFLLPFYKLTGGSLDMGFWAALTIQYLWALTAFLLVKKWWGTLAGVAVGILLATPVSVVAWGFMYVPLLSLIFFYACLKTLENPKLLPWLFLLFGFGCTTYAVFYALGIPFLYVVIKSKGAIKKFLWGILLASLPYTSLVIFDLRHNFINLKNILAFAGTTKGQGQQAGYFLKVFYRAVETSWLNHPLSQPASTIVFMASVMVLIGGLYLFRKNRWFIGLWLVSSLIPMAFYKGNVSEYYYSPVILLLPIFLAGLMTKVGNVGKFGLIIIILAITGLRTTEILNKKSGVTLQEKVELVNKLEALKNKYSVSFELGLGEDSGYTTIFNKLGTNYVTDGSAQLYTITSNNQISGVKIGSTKHLAIYQR